MRVVVEVVAGPHTGRRRLLSIGQEVIVGRSEYAGLSCEFDHEMLEQHFTLLVHRSGCRMTGAESTRVNKLPTMACHLYDGDVIEAGNSRFRVHIEGEASIADGSTESITPNTQTIRPAKLFHDHQLTGEFEIELCRNGSVLHMGSTVTTPIQDLAEVVSRRHEAFLVLHHYKIDQPVSIPDPEYVFSFLDPAVVSTASPIIVPAYEVDDWATLIADSWGHDAVIVLYTNCEAEETIRKFRRAVCPPGSTTINGYSWPQLLGQLLAWDESGSNTVMFDIAEMILVEAADFPERWQLFSNRDQSELLREAGLRPTLRENAETIE
jgi:hypothetical protein